MTKELTKQIYGIIVNESEKLLPIYMAKVNDIDTDYFNNIQCDCKELPAELNLELKDKVVDDLRQYAMTLLGSSTINQQIGNALSELTEEERDSVIAEVKKQISEYRHGMSILNGGNQFREEVLDELYDKVKNRPIVESITQLNKNDVIVFHHTLMNKTYEECKDVWHECVENVLS